MTARKRWISLQECPWHRGWCLGWAGGVGTVTKHTAHSSGLLAPSGVLRQGHYPLMALQGQPFVKRAGSPSPVLSTGKAVPANWAPPRQGWGMNVPQRLRAKCGEGPEEGLDRFQFPVAWFPPAQVVCGALMLSTYPVLILTPHTT